MPNNHAKLHTNNSDHSTSETTPLLSTAETLKALTKNAPPPTFDENGDKLRLLINDEKKSIVVTENESHEAAMQAHVNALAIISCGLLIDILISLGFYNGLRHCDDYPNPNNCREEQYQLLAVTNILFLCCIAISCLAAAGQVAMTEYHRYKNNIQIDELDKLESGLRPH